MAIDLQGARHSQARADLRKQLPLRGRYTQRYTIMKTNLS